MIEQTPSSSQEDQDLPHDSVDESKLSNAEMEALKALVIDNPQAAFLCTALKADNPNYLAIIHANQAFCQNFNISQEVLIG